MKLKLLIAGAMVAILFTQCDPTKKLYKSEEYLGEIDTSYTPYEYEEYEYEGYEDEYYDYESYAYDTAVSPYSPSLYRGSEKRKRYQR